MCLYVSHCLVMIMYKHIKSETRSPYLLSQWTKQQLCKLVMRHLPLLAYWVTSSLQFIFNQMWHTSLSTEEFYLYRQALALWLSYLQQDVLIVTTKILYIPYTLRSGTNYYDLVLWVIMDNCWIHESSLLLKFTETVFRNKCFVVSIRLITPSDITFGVGQVSHD